MRNLDTLLRVLLYMATLQEGLKVIIDNWQVSVPALLGLGTVLAMLAITTVSRDVDPDDSYPRGGVGSIGNA